MKKLCYSAFIAFWSSVATFVAIQTLANQNNNSAVDEAAATEKTYTLADVAKHPTETDCWMAIEGKVYDLTTYLSKHPAGPATMVTWCGTEATDGMRTKGIGSDHSSFAWGQLNSYYIGELK